MGGAGNEKVDVTDDWSILQSSYAGGRSAGSVEYVMSSIESRTGYLTVGWEQLSNHQLTIIDQTFL